MREEASVRGDCRDVISKKEVVESTSGIQHDKGGEGEGKGDGGRRRVLHIVQSTLRLHLTRYRSVR